MPNKPQKIWLLLADSHRARLLNGHRTKHDRPHLEEEAHLDFVVPEHQHERLTARASKPGHSFADRNHGDDELAMRFAREVTTFLQHKVAEFQLEQVFLFAPPRFLGALRKVMPKQLADRLVDHHGELTQMTVAQIASHPEVAKLLQD